MPRRTGKHSNICAKGTKDSVSLEASICTQNGIQVYSRDFHLHNSFLTSFPSAPAASEDTVIGFLGQSVTLPCQHSSWSRNRNSMCWGKGACPNSKCNQELLHTDGTKVVSRKSFKYTLQGSIWWGDVSLTISNTNQEDSGVYCCRIEVPGWFNDVKKTVRLELRRGEERMELSSEKEPRGLW